MSVNQNTSCDKKIMKIRASQTNKLQVEDLVNSTCTLLLASFTTCISSVVWTTLRMDLLKL